MAIASDVEGQFYRIAATDRFGLRFTLDGVPLKALEGDTILTAVLTNSSYLRRFEFGGQPRAGFCLIGACQDCWVRSENGQSLRACTTLIEPGMELLTEQHDDA